jgi:hypothetical protein
MIFGDWSSTFDTRRNQGKKEESLDRVYSLIQQGFINHLSYGVGTDLRPRKSAESNQIWSFPHVDHSIEEEDPQ